MKHPKEPGGWQDAQAPAPQDDGKGGQQTQTGGAGKGQQGGRPGGPKGPQTGQQR